MRKRLTKDMTKARDMELFKLWETNKYTMMELAEMFKIDKRQIYGIIKGYDLNQYLLKK